MALRDRQLVAIRINPHHEIWYDQIERKYTEKLPLAKEGELRTINRTLTTIIPVIAQWLHDGQGVLTSEADPLLRGRVYNMRMVLTQEQLKFQI